MSITGSCLCKANWYRISKTLAQGSEPRHCHCFKCRKWTGAVVYSAINYHPDDIQLFSSQNPSQSFTFANQPSTLTSYSSSPGLFRTFCTQCSGRMFMYVPKAPTVGLMVGTLDEEYIRDFKPTMQLWCENALENIPVGPREDVKMLLQQDRGSEGSKNFSKGRPDSEEVKGECLCGRIKYTSSKPLSEQKESGHCHCTSCRKNLGALAMTIVTFSIDDIRVQVDGKDSMPYEESIPHLHQYESSSGNIRQSCKRCGSSLFWYSSQKKEVDLTAGTLNDLRLIKLKEAIYCENMLPHAPIGPADIPQLRARGPDTVSIDFSSL